MILPNPMPNRSEPLISVITVCRNASEYIRQCMESVIAQKFDDFEYVVIDGNSTDGTQAIIEEYKEHIAYWHSKPDRGLSHAFNLGIEHSSGKWLMFLNADDYFVDFDVLSGVAKHLRSNPDVDVIFGQVTVVKRDDGQRIVGGPYGRAFSWNKFLLTNTIPHQGAFINRSIFSRVGMYTEKLQLAADYELFLRAGPNIQAKYVPVLIAFMRDGGLSKKNQYKCLAEWHEARVFNSVAPRWKLRMIYTYILCRATLGMYYRRLVG